MVVPPLLALRTREPVSAGEAVPVLELVEEGVVDTVEVAEALALVTEAV